MTLSGKQASHLPQLPEPGEKNICSDDQIPDISKVFERFYRGDSSHSSQIGGSGIGLAIVKKIIEDHKGKIWAESVEGEGTTMHINLLKDMDKRNYICIEDNRKKEKK